MTVTLAGLDSFGHRTSVSTTAQAGSGFTGIYDGQTISISGAIAFDAAQAPSTRHPGSMKYTQSSSGAVNQQTTIPAGHRVVVAQVKFRITAATATADRFLSLIGPTNPPIFRIDSTGHVQAACGTSGPQTTSGTYADSNWHRVDALMDCSGTTFTIDWYVDGVHQTGVSVGSQTAADITAISRGNNSTGTLVVWLADLVWGYTSAEYPYPNISCLPLYPNGEGTDNLGTTNKIQDEAGAFANLYQHVDDWASGTANTTDYITYPSTTTGDAATDYAEFTFDDPPTGATIIDVQGIIGGFAAGTTADTADVQVKNGGSLVDHIGNLIDYSGSTSALGYFKQFLARPAVTAWTNAILTGITARWGFSNDTNPQPRLSAIMLEYACLSDGSVTSVVGTAPASAAVPVLNASSQVTSVVGTAPAAAGVPVFSASTSVPSVVGTAAAAAPTPVLTADANVTSVVGTAPASAPTPVFAASASVAAVVADAPAAAGVPVITAGASVASVAPNAAAAAIAPAITASSSVSPTVANAAAAAIVPGITANANIASVVATAVAEAEVPQIMSGAQVLAVVATAVANALAPILNASSNVFAVVATASAMAPAPSLPRDTFDVVVLQNSLIFPNGSPWPDGYIVVKLLDLTGTPVQRDWKNKTWSLERARVDVNGVWGLSLPPNVVAGVGTDTVWQVLEDPPDGEGDANICIVVIPNHSSTVQLQAVRVG